MANNIFAEGDASQSTVFLNYVFHCPKPHKNGESISVNLGEQMYFMGEKPNAIRVILSHGRKTNSFVPCKKIVYDMVLRLEFGNLQLA